MVLFGANLITSEMFSRKSFDISMKEFFGERDSKSVLSFEDFFDYQHFQLYWQNVANNSIYQFKDVEKCFSRVQGRTVSLQRLRWQSSNDNDILRMLTNSNVSHTVTRASSVIDRIFIPSGTIIRIKSKMKMLGFYDFKQHQKRRQFLLQVHESIRPSRPIVKAIHR